MMNPDTTFLQHVKHKTSKKPTSELEVLWQRIEKHTKRNANVVIKKQNLFVQFQQQVEPYEHMQAHMVAEQVVHLSQFIMRKSLSEQQRKELIEWIEDDIDFLSAHPFIGPINVAEVINAFQAQLKEQNQATINAIPPEELNELRLLLQQDFAGLELTDEQLRDIALEPQKVYQYLDEQGFVDNDHEQPFNHHNSEDEPDWDGFFEDEPCFNRQQAKHQKTNIKLEKLFKGSQLNKMYKRLASKLHPDKEPDPAKKAQKHQLMQQLGQARKTKDGFSLLQLYITYIDDDVDFDEQTKANLIPLLKNKITELNEQYRAQQTANDEHSFVWRKFNGRSKAQIKQNFAEHIAALQIECDEIAARLNTCTTVNTLKKELNERIQNKRHAPLSLQEALNSMFNF